jgi:hypothetical protein
MLIINKKQTYFFCPPLQYGLYGSVMLEVDTSGTLLVQEGVPWPHKKDPCSREMIHLLEKAESYVSWFQPMNGDVDDQFPTIRVGAKYCKLSLRLQKALFRHIRLARGFVNREKTPAGVTKLRIPTSLFTDKKKTATRFMVNPSHNIHVTTSALSRITAYVLFNHWLCIVQNMRSKRDTSNKTNIDTKASCGAVHLGKKRNQENLGETFVRYVTQIKSGVNEHEPSMQNNDPFSEYKRKDVMQTSNTGDIQEIQSAPYTKFHLEDDEMLMELMMHLNSDCPDMMRSKQELLDHVARIFDHITK